MPVSAATASAWPAWMAALLELVGDLLPPGVLNVVTGKGSVISWIKLVQCLGQEGQLQTLFKPVTASIAVPPVFRRAYWSAPRIRLPAMFTRQ